MDDDSQLLNVDQLYPASQELNTRLSSALGLLLQGVLRLERALDAIRAKDAIGADDQVSHLLLVLQEMFCYRDLGEGFANVVSGCIAAVQNNAGAQCNEKQLIALNTALHTLRKKPFLTFESSLDVIERLEGSGLTVNAQGLDAVQDLLIGNSVR